MALLFLDSFDHYLTADLPTKYTSVSAGSGGTIAIAAVGRRSSTGAKFSTAVSGAYSGAALKTLAPSGTTIVLGLAFTSVTAFGLANTGVTGANGTLSGSLPTCLLLVRNASADQCWIRVDQAGTLTVIRGTTVLGTTSVALTQGVVAYIEILLTLHASAGVVTIRVNGASALSLTGQNTAASGVNGWNEIRLGYMGGSGAMEWNLDDLYVLDGSGAAPWNTFLGDCRVDVRLPTAPGATTGWTPVGAAANWQCVDDATPNGDTDYTSAAAAGLTDTFVVQDAPVPGATIFGIQHCLLAKKSDAGICALAPVVRHAGVDNVGAVISPGTSYGYGLVIAATNPGTGAAWVEADFNAAEFGYKRTS